MSMNEMMNRALNATQHGHTSEGYIQVDGAMVSFDLQNGPVKEAGRNGTDATDLIRYAIGLYREFNSVFPCRENSITLTKLEEALHWQESRTKDRESRGVEGVNKA